MNIPHPPPAAWLKTASAAARWALGLALSAWLLFGVVWGVLHWVIVPRIGEFRVLLEAQASKALALPVKIGAISATSNGLIPSVELSDVRLQDPQGRDALVLGRVVAALSSRSLLRLGLEQLYIDQPQLDIRRTADGKFLLAGIDLSTGGKPESSEVADWIFSQTELVLKNGQIRWTDETRGLPTLTLSQVDLVVRNAFRSHKLRLDATPPPALGERFTASASFRQPLLSTRSGRWQEWSGNAFALFTRVDIAALGQHVNTGVDAGRGQGAVRAWIDIDRGEVANATADLALVDVSASLGEKLAPLELSHMAGRLGGRARGPGFEFKSEGLQFRTSDGLVWPGGNVSVRRVAVGAATSLHAGNMQTELAGDNLDLAALAEIAVRLPLDARWRERLTKLAPRGLVESLRAQWSGPIDVLKGFEARGRVVKLALASAGPKLPGVQGASLNFDITQAGGKAAIQIDNGALELPGILEEPRIPLTRLSVDAKWQIDGDNLAVQLPNLKLANADAQGEFDVKWHTSKETGRGPQARFPGVLELLGSVSRCDGTRVHRYLPVAILPQVRHYVREAVTRGVASDVKFKIKGDLHDFPFVQNKTGDFRITANVSDVTFAYAPPLLLPAGSAPWPELAQLSGELVIDRQMLQVKSVKARLSGRTQAAAIQVTKAEGVIPDLFSGATVQVNGEARSSLAGLLATMNGSPLGAMMGSVLGDMNATGNADIRLKLNLPVAAIDKVALQGSVALADSDIKLSAQGPVLSRSKGVVNFSESGFAIPSFQARLFGGDVVLQGGSMASGNATTVVASAPGAASAPKPAGWRALPNLVIRAQGSLDAEALKQSPELGLVSRLAQHASGISSYSAILGVRQGEPELTVSSSLSGMALALPKPFGKTAEMSMPLRFQLSSFRTTTDGSGVRSDGTRMDQIQVDVGRIAQVHFVRDISGPAARVVRGAVGVGLAADEAAPLPSDGVVANINLAQADVDAWNAVLASALEPPTQGGPVAGHSGAQTFVSSSTPSAALTYLPAVLAVRAGELTVGGRKFNNVVLGGSRSGTVWRANVDASELNGYMEYRPGVGNQAGRVYARLARLTLAQSSARDVENLLDEQPASIPALDVVVDDFELRGKRLGRVEIDAVNRGAGAPARDGGIREWRLNKFNIQMPEASLSATGNWVSLNAQGPDGGTGVSRLRAERRRTVMNFKLDINDSGGLLARLGMKDVIRQGKGKLEGQVAWVGSPLMLDYPSLGGAFAVNVESGQFLKADPGLAKLLGVLSLQSLPRRLALDFRDVFSDGFAFDFIRGDVKIEHGIASTNNLQMKGVNAAVLMDGQADIARETQAVRVVVVPEINAGTASLIATVINPAIGLSTFLAQVLLRRPLIESATQEFQIEGTWVDPKVIRVAPRAPPAAEPKPELTQ